MPLLVVLVFVLAGRIHRRSSCAAESPFDIPKRRYVQGEITREDFERLKQDIKDSSGLCGPWKPKQASAAAADSAQNR